MEIEQDGKTITVYTQEEVAAQVEAAKTEVSGELGTKLTAAEAEKTRLEGLLNERAGEFGQFRKLNEEQKAKLSQAELANYQIQEQLNTANESIASLKGEIAQGKIDAVIAAQCGNDPDLITKVKTMYGKIDMPAGSPEEIAARVRAAFGAIAPQDRNVAAFIASTGGNGAYQPPQPQNAADKPSERVAQGAQELGLKIE